MRSIYLTAATAVFSALLSAASMAQEETKLPDQSSVPVTAKNPEIPVDELALLVKPLTADELKVEAEAWMNLLRVKTRETSQAELAVKQKNKSIDRAEEVQEAIEDTQEVLSEVKDASREAAEAGTLATTEEAQELAREAREAVDQTVDSIESAIATSQEVRQNRDVQDALDAADKSKAEALSGQAAIAREASAEASIAADKAVEAAESGDTVDAAKHSEQTVQSVREAGAALQTTSAVIDQAIDEQQDVAAIADHAGRSGLDESARLAAELAQREMEDKKDILVSVTELRTQRTALTDRLNVVLDVLSAKLGKTAVGAENEFILPFRLYAQSVNSVKVDVTDTQSAVSNIWGWLRSDLGGIRLARNIGYFGASVLSFWLLGWILGRLVDRALKLTRITLELMRSVIVRMVRRVTLVIGIIVGLAAMDINVGPILAVVGAAGFVVAFALQNTLSNFASGIMIMIYRPFDVGDLISVGGVTGEARSMNLVSTTIATRDNQLLVVPNNTIWNNIIVNITGSDTRRVDLFFRIGYRDDIEAAQSLIQGVLDQHPLILKEPEPTIGVAELGEVAVTLSCRPWAKTEDYWQVYREVTRNVKERFEQAGMKPPFLEANMRGMELLRDNAAPQSAFPVS